jgi:hypothetical protein
VSNVAALRGTGILGSEPPEGAAKRQSRLDCGRIRTMPVLLRC